MEVFKVGIILVLVVIDVVVCGLDIFEVKFVINVIVSLLLFYDKII